MVICTDGLCEYKYYIDSLKNGDNIFIKVMNNIFFTGSAVPEDIGQ